MRKNSVKNTRINSEVQKALADMIRSDIKDPRIAPMTCVTAVEVAPDLKTCKVWISVLGDAQARTSTLAGLKSAEGYLRHQLATTLNLRNTPTLSFISDESTEYGMKMSQMIDDVMMSMPNRDDEEEEQ